MKSFSLKISILILACALMASGKMNAQYFHQLGFTANGGWSSFANNCEAFSVGRGFHTTLGFNYELQYGHLLFDTGAGVQWRSAGVSAQDDAFVYEDELQDTQNEPFHLKVITEQRTDYTRNVELQIPALVGGIYGHFYFLGGLKLNVPLYGVSRTHAHLTTQGLYDRYLLPLTSMDYHGFRTDVHTSTRGPKVAMLPVDLKASFELGYNFASSDVVMNTGERIVREYRMRIAAYCDYSLIPQHKNTVPAAPVSVNAAMPYDLGQYHFTNILNSAPALNSYLAGVNLGVKFTFMVGDRQRFVCMNCESAVEAGINNPNSGVRRKDNRQADSTSRPDQTRKEDGSKK